MLVLIPLLVGGGSPTNQVLAQRSPTSPAAKEKGPALCEPHNQGSNESETREFLFLARGSHLLQGSDGAAGTVWLLRCSGHQPMTRL